MRNRIKKTLINYSVAVMFYVALYGALCLYMYLDKPLFVNEFGYFGRLGPIPYWSLKQSDLKDSGGNRFVADFEMNLFIMVRVPTSHCPPLVTDNARLVDFILPKEESGCSPDDDSISVKVAKDVLVIINTDGTIERIPIRDGLAEGMFRAVKESDSADKIQVVYDMIGDN